jgi:hypothetical protein
VPRVRRDADPTRLPARLLLAFAAAWLVALLVVAVLVPYHATDALVFGSWSVSIADVGSLHTPGVVNSFLHRPLFYGGQGFLWHWFGVHEWLGRVWAWLFMAALLGAVIRLAGGLRRDVLTAGLAAVLLLAVPDVAIQAAAGQTDVPVAALIALVAMLLWTVPPSPARAAGLVALAAAAMLAKPSALPALVGLLAGCLIGARGELRSRLVRDAAPVVGGVVLALVYDATQAAFLHQSVADFLSGALTDRAAARESEDAFHAAYSEARRTVVLAGQWLGPYLAVLALFSVIYAVGRVAGAAHRRAALVALPAAIVLSWLLPFAAQTGSHSVRVGPIEAGQPGATVAFLLLLVPLWLFARHAEADAPPRDRLARLLLWAGAVVLAWMVQAPTETRYVAAAWAPLVLLMAPVLAGAVRAAAARGALAVGAVAAIALLAAVLNLRSFDGLGVRPDGTISAGRALADFQLSDLGHPERMRALADPQLAGLLAGLREAAGRDGALVTSDGRMIFFFGARATVRVPESCADVRGFAAAGLLGNVAAPLPALSGCGRVVASVPGSYTVYAIR